MKGYGSLRESDEWKRSFIRWAETLRMLEHGYGRSFFPDELDRVPIPNNQCEFSELVAREQVKLNILRDAGAASIDWDL